MSYFTVAILGAGGLALEVATYLQKEGRPTSFLMTDRDGDVGFWNKTIVPISYPIQNNTTGLNIKYISGIGSAKGKKQVIESLNIPDDEWYNIYAEQFMGYGNTIGVGTVLCPGVSITSNIIIGKHVLINLNCTVGHDATIGDYTTLYPDVNVSGNVFIGECCELGTNCVILPGVKIGNNCIIGAGAVVNKDIPDNSMAVGVPAKVIKSI